MKRRNKFPGFWAVMPHKTRVAFITFLFGKFFWCPLFIVLMFVNDNLATCALVAWGICIVVAAGFALSEMFGKKVIPTRFEVEEWMNHYDIRKN